MGGDVAQPPPRPGAPTRRRGARLVSAIHQAVLAEIAEVGFGGLTMERIAARAKTGRMPLYRRWASLEELILDTLDHALPARSESGAPNDTGDLRADLLTVLRKLAETLAGPAGPALRVLGQEHKQHPKLAAMIEQRVFAPRNRLTTELLRRYAVRGEIFPDAPTSLAAEVGESMVLLHYMLEGEPPGEAELAAILDQAALPALGYTPPQPPTSTANGEAR
jgi:AcrR family transcriptional regulator